MQKTENLELNIIEGTDVPAYAPFNENMNKIDENVKKVDDEIKSLQTTSESVISRLSIIDEEQTNQNNLILKNKKQSLKYYKQCLKLILNSKTKDTLIIQNK